MTNKEKSIRDMDTILVRVPDGMKERIAQRAKASGRSMSGEVASILTEILNQPDEIGLRQLEQQRMDLLSEMTGLKARLDAVQQKMVALTDEIAARREYNWKRGRQGS